MRSAIVFCTLMSLSLFAQQEPISADRPGFADGPDTMHGGVFQLESGVVRDDLEWGLESLLRYGLGEAFELQAGFDATDDDSDFAVGFKWGIRESVSLIGSIDTERTAELRILGGVELGEGLSFIPNAGIEVSEGGDPVAVLSSSIEKEIGTLVPFVDFELRAGADDTSAIVDAGVAWAIRNDVQLDLSGGTAIAGDEYPDWFVSAGISRRF